MRYAVTRHIALIILSPIILSKENRDSSNCLSDSTVFPVFSVSSHQVVCGVRDFQFRRAA